MALETINKNFELIEHKIGDHKVGSILVSNEKFVLLSVTIRTNDNEIERLMSFINKFDIKIDYESLYGQSFTLDSCDSDKIKT